MSDLHSELHNKSLGLRVRVKFVDLDNTCKVGPVERVSRERMASVVGLGGERALIGQATETETHRSTAECGGEICMHTGARISLADFDAHVDECQVCANRVELQLDFIQTLEAAVFQRNGDPDSEKIHGALLIGAPKLNFAVCGEIEFE
jgi:hypothetical protein